MLDKILLKTHLKWINLENYILLFLFFIIIIYKLLKLISKLKIYHKLNLQIQNCKIFLFKNLFYNFLYIIRYLIIYINI